MATEMGSGEKGDARTVPGGVVGTASALVIARLSPSIFRFSRSAHFSAGAIPVVAPLDSCPLEGHALASTTRIRRPRRNAGLQCVIAIPLYSEIPVLISRNRKMVPASLLFRKPTIGAFTADLRCRYMPRNKACF